MTRLFVSRKGIAAVLGIGEGTLAKHYGAELDVGDGKAELSVRTMLYAAAKKGSVKAMIHLAETKLGDTKKVIQEHQARAAGRSRRTSPSPRTSAAPRWRRSRPACWVHRPPEADGFDPGA